MKLAKWILYALYSITLLILVFGKGNDFRHSSVFDLENFTNFVPFKLKIISFLSGEIWAYDNFKEFCKDFFGNLLLLFPLTLFTMLGEGLNNGKKVLLIALSISLLIEFFQLLLGVGIADIDDVILNTTGAGLGIWFCNWIKQQKFWPSLRSFLRLPAS